MKPITDYISFEDIDPEDTKLLLDFIDFWVKNSDNEGVTISLEQYCKYRNFKPKNEWEKEIAFERMREEASWFFDLSIEVLSKRGKKYRETGFIRFFDDMRYSRAIEALRVTMSQTFAYIVKWSYDDEKILPFCFDPYRVINIVQRGDIENGKTKLRCVVEHERNK